MAHFACINWNMPFQRRFVQGSYDHGDLPLNQGFVECFFFDKAHPNTGEQENQKKQKLFSSTDSGLGFLGCRLKLILLMEEIRLTS